MTHTPIRLGLHGPCCGAPADLHVVERGGIVALGCPRCCVCRPAEPLPERAVVTVSAEQQSLWGGGGANSERPRSTDGRN